MRTLRIGSGTQLRELAHARTGDKGDYAFLAEHVTAERVRAHFRPCDDEVPAAQR